MYLAQAVNGGIALDLLIVLAAAGTVALIFNRLRIMTMPGFLVAGALIGPHAFGLIPEPDRVGAVTQLSTILLMFIVGLQLDIGRLRSGLLSIVFAAVLCTVMMVLMMWPFGWAATGAAPGGLVLAMAFAIAATAAPLRMLEARKELHTTYGRLAFGITLFQDLIAVAMLAMMPALGHWAHAGEGSDGSGWIERLRAGAVAIGVTAVLLLIAKLGLPRLFAEAGRVGGEVLIVISAAVALGAAVLSSAMGFSPELGAFIAGLLLASTPFRHQIAGQFIPMRDLFLAVFFTAVGMSLPISVFATGWGVVLAGLAVLIAAKVASIAISAWCLGASARVGLLAGATLAPAGEFTLLMLAQAVAAGLITSHHAGHGIAVVFLSILAAPLVAWGSRKAIVFAERLPPAPWIRHSSLRPREENIATDAPRGGAFRAVVAGYGPVGRNVADALSRQGVEITLIEMNARTVVKQGALGRNVVYGDASNPDVLGTAGVQEAHAFILTMPDEDAMLRACRAARGINPAIFIAARANTLSRGLQAMQLGADHAVVEEMVTAEAMAEEVLTRVKDRMSGEDNGPKLYTMQDPSGRD